MHTKKELAEKIAEAKIQPLKSLGQNFLVNPQICLEIINKAKSYNPQFLCEVGPGLGALTEGFIDLKDKLLLLELDKGLVEYWQKRDFNIIHGDALKASWGKLINSHPAVLVSNLPYSIAASLVIELSLVQPTFDKMILMFQKEVAQRAQAKTGDEDYGFLTVVAQAFWNIQKLIDAGPQDFYPVPHVGSRVLVFEQNNSTIDKQGFVTFVKLAFSQRRKFLIKNLSQSYQLEKLKQVFQNLDIDVKTRAQDINVDLFQRLFIDLSL